MRAPGGFSIVWHEDELSLLVQLQSHPGEYQIALFQIGVAEPRILSDGFGIHLDALRGWIATQIEGYVTIVDPFSGVNYPLRLGDPLGWVGDRVVIGGPGPLVLMDPVTAEVTEISGHGDWHAYFNRSPDGSRYAWLNLTMDDSPTTVTVTDSEFNVLHEWPYEGYVGSATWGGPDSLLIGGMTDYRLTINELRIVDGALFPLVGWSENELPAPVPTGAP